MRKCLCQMLKSLLDKRGKQADAWGQTVLTQNGSESALGGWGNTTGVREWRQVLGHMPLKPEHKMILPGWEMGVTVAPWCWRSD